MTEPQQGLRRHKLLPQGVREKFPAWMATDGQGMDAEVVVKFFSPYNRYTLYVTEFDGDDTLFGYCVSPLGDDCDEWGYQSFLELAQLTGPLRVPLIERDIHFPAITVAEAVHTR
jgi:hypothetical protein